MSKKIDEVLEKDYPVERRWKATAKSRGIYNGEFVKVILENVGIEKGLDMIAQVWGNIAKKSTIPGLKSFGIEGDNAKTLAEFLYAANTIIGTDIELIPDSNEQRAGFRVYRCPPFGKDPSKVKHGPEICEAMLNFERTVAALINPKLRISCPKLLTKGDSYCEIIAELVN